MRDRERVLMNVFFVLHNGVRERERERERDGKNLLMFEYWKCLLTVKF